MVFAPQHRRVWMQWRFTPVAHCGSLTGTDVAVGDSPKGV